MNTASFSSRPLALLCWAFSFGLHLALHAAPSTGAFPAVPGPPVAAVKTVPFAFPADVLEGLRSQPSLLFVQLASHTKPMWRSLYRPPLTKSLPSRALTAYAVGALMSDLSLAIAARDEQQVRNLCQDVAVQEKSLGFEGELAACRQRILGEAQASAWEKARVAVEEAFVGQLSAMKEQRDEQLCHFLKMGRWLRTWQVSCSVVLDRELFSKDLLAVGDPSHITVLLDALEVLVEQEIGNNKCLKEAHRRLLKFRRLWSKPAVDAAERLKETAALLKDCLDPLLDSEREKAT